LGLLLSFFRLSLFTPAHRHPIQPPPAGDGGHAGAQLMAWRNDASLAAAELALFVERAALGTGAHLKQGFFVLFWIC
jgi:hypothetical protein